MKLWNSLPRIEILVTDMPYKCDKKKCEFPLKIVFSHSAILHWCHQQVNKIHQNIILGFNTYLSK